jgi:transcriptional regulator GlxA family with amidase domain
MALQRVAALVLPGVAPFELGVVCEAFGLDRSDMGVPRSEFTLVTPSPGMVPTNLGFALEVTQPLSAAADADLVCVPAVSRAEVPEAALDLLRETVARGARVMSVCSGAFVLGEAGLLDGRHCTTHWMHTEELKRRHPQAIIDPMVLYVEDGPVLTSAGTAAGIDLCLHILRQEYGDDVAGIVARRMVVPPHRDGGQAQYIEDPLPEPPVSLAPLLDWLKEHLAEEITVADMAHRMWMSPRTFARRFAAETGTAPYKWLLHQRVSAAARLLEVTDLPLDEVARQVGLGDATLLRHHFKALRGTTPSAYRTNFAGFRPRDLAAGA